MDMPELKIGMVVSVSGEQGYFTVSNITERWSCMDRLQLCFSAVSTTGKVLGHESIGRINAVYEAANPILDHPDSERASLNIRYFPAWQRPTRPESRYKKALEGEIEKARNRWRGFGGEDCRDAHYRGVCDGLKRALELLEGSGE